jgi:tetratricopeptide (TPR) repeat protein
MLTLNLILAADAADQVTRRSDRSVLRGEFTAMTTASVKIKQVNGQEVEVPVSDIFNVAFDMQPSTLTQAQSNERSGALDAALEKLTAVQKEYGGDDKRLVEDIKFLIARTKVKSALANPAVVADAQKAISDFRTQHKTNFRYLEASLLEAQLLSLDAANADAAEKLLKEVQASPVKGFQLQAGVQLGRLLLSKKDTAGALTAFDRSFRPVPAMPELHPPCSTGCWGKLSVNNFRDRLTKRFTTLNEIITKASESETQTLAEAWVLKGDCQRTKNLPKDALWAYLQVDVLYPSEPAAHAEALYRLADLWAPAGHQDRADDARQRLMEKYPNSSWAKQGAPATP